MVAAKLAAAPAYSAVTGSIVFSLASVATLIATGFVGLAAAWPAVVPGSFVASPLVSTTSTDFFCASAVPSAAVTDMATASSAVTSGSHVAVTTTAVL